MRADEQSHDVIVVGAGFAGLKAASELKAAGQRVVVLEARERVGGRSMAGEICGEVVDFGGQWVGPQQKLLLAEAAAQGVSVRPQYDAGESVMSRHGKVRRYRGDIPKLPFLALMELAVIERRWKRDTATLPADAWTAPRAHIWDALSLEAWVLRHVRTAGAREFVRVVTGALLCVDAAQVSYLFFLDMLRRNGGLQAMLGVKGGAQQDKFQGGAWQIAKRMADALGEAVLLNAPVTAIAQDADGVRVEAGGRIYAARRAIVATPPGLAARIAFAPHLSAPHQSLFTRMTMGAVIKVHVAYKTPFWRLQGLSGAAVSTSHDLGVVFDQTPVDERIGLLVGLIEGRHAVAMSALSAEARRAQVMADLHHYFGAEAAAAIGYVEQDWVTEPWSEGGYAAFMPPGVMTGFGPALRTPFGRIHFAGTETATAFAGYLDGALQSGIRAAAEVSAAA